jgi:hypothetical protein
MSEVIYAIKVASVASSGLRIMHVKIGKTKNIKQTIRGYRRSNPEGKLLNLWVPNGPTFTCERGVHKLASKYAYQQNSEKFIFLQDKYKEFAENINLLLKSTTESKLKIRPKKQDILFCKGKGVEAKGKFIKDGKKILILAGSFAVKDAVDSLKGKGAEKKRQKLIESNIMVKNNENYIFEENYLASSPSRAASIILGRPSNGWDEWTDSKGKTLDKLVRV